MDFFTILTVSRDTKPGHISNMARRMSYVSKLADSDVLQFTYRTPAKLLAKLKGITLLVSLSFIREEAPYTVRTKVGEKIKFRSRRRTKI
jgi:hypothetical protein